jgi:uncharacterized protein DUF1559
MRTIGHRRGVTRGDVVVLVILIGATFLLVLMGLSRAREGARLAGCTNNLAQIGFALALHDQMQGHLPTVIFPPLPGGAGPKASAGPLKQLLDSLEIPDLTELRDGMDPPKRHPGQVHAEVPVPGFFCRSDPNATAGRWPAPVSYRATTGDNPRGDNGAFAPGRSWSLAAIEARDGLSYTAAFSERLVGSGGRRPEGLTSYRLVPPPLSASSLDSAGLDRWREDAGSSWVGSDYRSTLYNHTLPPNGRPSCIADDGRSAYMGASSGHVRGVNVLRLDGSVSLTVPSIAPAVWRELATVEGVHRDATP